MKKALRFLALFTSLIPLAACSLVDSGGISTSDATKYEKYVLDGSEEKLKSAILKTDESNILIGVKQTKIVGGFFNIQTVVSYDMYPGVIYKKSDNNYYVLSYISESIVSDYNSGTVEYSVISSEEVSYTANIVGYDLKNNIVVYKFLSDDDMCVSEIPDDYTPKCGEMIYSISSHRANNLNGFSSYDYDYMRLIKDGTISYSDERLFMHGAMSSVYDYGSSVYDYDGNLIGINVSNFWDLDYVSKPSSDEHIEDFNFAINAKTLKKITSYIEENGNLTHPNFAGSYKIYTRAEGEESDILPDNTYTALMVGKVEKNNDFMLKAGDLITKINGKTISSELDFINACLSSILTDEIKLTVYRNTGSSYTMIEISNI